ncbi:phosphoribosyltransferase [Campylobacter concisus]|jgi:phosphoribosyltransferase|uniref:Phosphoribosyltransferase n=3 Tax=Campylobacter concisus TaxID=199 RepID=A0A1Y5N6W1_9BACT|nr:phosphoribosyltransferase family protein [Campylobacter concisus]AVX43786.1 Xanthine-guanine phosphoribosyltransferase [Campylobacter concisus]EAT97588.1 putative nucleotide phosphoribosyltransferase [Campylobacter concisus 13826]ERJ23340.1 Xanthine-guanine phosphoribosyltransferase [Campylobacter concisus UNSW1]ERJ27451.1 Xanthine-guanine phosphoribosyltransferase [Campylobacter concisus ATCC 51561]ERJ31600.1 Xanthine-guanine phosphoribosyltransferase [Campylobacter concisus UNSW2]
MIFYSYDEFAVDAKKMAKQIKDEFDPEVILAVARGGLTLGHSLAVALENRNLFTLNSIHYEDTNKLDTIQIFNVPDLSKYTKILLVDDIIDSGESMVEIKRELLKRYPNLDIKIATVFYKEKALLLPEFKVKEAHDWVEFFWDIHI